METQFIDGEETHVWKWIVPTNSNFKMPSYVKKNEGSGLVTDTTVVPETNEASQFTQDTSVPSIFPNLQSTFKAATLSNLTNAQPFETNAQSSANGWQGDAFNRSEKLIHSPTPCLKIRNMFDPNQINSDNRISVKIHNDILEKCSISNAKYTTNNAILHISCDKKSKEGCVYVKCSSNDAAGRVYQNLNGTWYNGKLLNVKFLREDRYLERFPESANFKTPLESIMT